MTLLAAACQNKKAEQVVATETAPAVEAAPTPVAPVATIDEALFSTPLGIKLKADFNPNPVSQAAKDQNIIIEYALKNNLDVKRTASGLYYVMEKEGKGTSPKLENRVSTQYKGYLLDGTEFDSSYKRGKPADFGVTEVVPGWTEALLMMKPGGKIKLLMPSILGWGQGGTPGGPIGPNTVTAFDMELVKIVQ